MPKQQSVTATTTGASSSVWLEPGEYVAYATADSWGEATVQSSPDDSSFITLLSPYTDADIALTANYQFIVFGNQYMRLNVTTHTDDITVTFQPLSQ